METKTEYDASLKDSITVAGTNWKPDHSKSNYFEVIIEKDLFKQIKHLQEIVVREDVYCIELDNDDCLILDRMHKGHDLVCVHDWFDEEDIDYVDENNRDDMPTMQGCDGMYLRITKTYIQWNWQDEHCVTGESCETAEIPIDDIEKAFTNKGK